jgi:short-subunit dehydrogenase
MPEPRADHPLALVTGASSGIGRGFCERLAAAGYGLVMVARDEAKMQALAEDLDRRYGTAALILREDLTQPGAAARIAEALATRTLVPEILVNNAGFGWHGRFEAMPPESIGGMLMVNAVAPTELVRALLPEMLARRRGRILNVASIAGLFPGPMMAVYYATKAYFLSLSEALSEELRGTGVTVTALCPGPTESEFFSRAGTVPTYRMPVASMESVVRAAYAGMMRGDRVVVPGAFYRSAAFLTRFTPKIVALRLIRYLQDRRQAGGA